MLSPDRIPDFAPLHARRRRLRHRAPRHRPHLASNWRTQPEIEEIAEAAGVTPTELHHLFRRWAGLTPKAFLQALTLDSARNAAARFRERARRLLRGRPVRPGPAARPVRHPRGDVARRMEGRRRRADDLTTASIPSPFGTALVMATRARPCRPRLRRSRRGEGRARRHAAPLAEGATTSRTARAPRRSRSASSITKLWRAGPAAARGADRHRLRGAGVGDAAAHPDGPRHHLFRHRRQRSAAPKASRAVGAAVGKNPISLRGAVPPRDRQDPASSPAITGASPASAPCWAGKPARSAA